MCGVLTTASGRRQAPVIGTVSQVLLMIPDPTTLEPQIVCVFSPWKLYQLRDSNVLGLSGVCHGAEGKVL